MNNKGQCNHVFEAAQKDKNSSPTCGFCGGSFWMLFGSKMMRCKKCKYVIHEKCIPKLQEAERSKKEKSTNPKQKQTPIPVKTVKTQNTQIKPEPTKQIEEKEIKQETGKASKDEPAIKKEEVEEEIERKEVKKEVEINTPEVIYDNNDDDEDYDDDEDEDDEEVEHIEEDDDDSDSDSMEISEIGGHSGDSTRVITQNELRDKLIEKAEDLSSQLALSVGETQLLLSSFKWSEDKLQNAYFDDIEKCQEQAGIVAPDEQSEDQINENGELSCTVCLDDVPMDKTYALGCGHRYCKECWNGYLKAAFFKFGQNVFRTTCMYPGCKAVVTFESWKTLSDKADYDKYWYFMIKNFVEQDKKYIICPSCGLILYNNLFRSGTQKSSACKCGKKLCFNCGSERHIPATCDQLKIWREKELNDEESLKLLKATTKPCFHCGFPTERNQGCNHMTCQNCKGEWCWMCRGDWKTHGKHTGGFYSCNKYEKSEAKKIDDWATGYLEDTSRYKHYYERYFNHSLSQNEMERKAQYIKSEASKYSTVSGNNFEQPIEDALSLIIDCREFLKFSYVYGFFLEDPKERAIFEFLQSNAEGITERLASMVIKPPKEIPIEDLKNLIRVTRNYLKNLEKGTEEGLLR